MGPTTRRLLLGVLTMATVLIAALPGAAEQASSALRPLQAGRLDVGQDHTCAILTDGTVRCWGMGLGGLLGSGTVTSIGDDEAPASSGTVDLGPGRTATQISAGARHTCAILDTGAVTCWGYSSYGELGYGNTATIGDNETPASAGTVNLGGHTAVDVTAGRNLTCVIIETGAVMCWGRNHLGQLGRGNTADIGDNETPGSAGTVNLGGHTAVAISAGDFHVCAVLSTGAIRCWGQGWARSGTATPTTSGTMRRPRPRDPPTWTECTRLRSPPAEITRARLATPAWCAAGDRASTARWATGAS